MGRIAIGAGLLAGGLALSHAEGLDVKTQPSVAELKQMSQADGRRVSSSVSQAVGRIGGEEGLALLEQMSQAEDRRVRSSVSAFGEIEEGLALFSEGALREEALPEFESGFPQERKENHHFDIQNRWQIDQAPFGRPADLRPEEDCLKCPSAKEENHRPVKEESLKPLNIRSCGIISDSYGLKKGGLSDYWAQELIGSDLLREELEKYPPPAKHNFISVIDLKKDNHDELVKNLVSDEGPQAVLPELHDKIFQINKMDYILDIFLSVTDMRKKVILKIFKGHSPSFINTSYYWNTGEYNFFKLLSPPSILVASSGNKFPSPLFREKSRAAKDFGAILIGSLSPRGVASGFSQEGEEVTILAPSDDYIISAVQGDYKEFGGTSGAAPLATGSLAGFEWLSGYHPSPKEAKLLLQRTALPTIHSHEKPRKNGAGMLNSYKLGILGQRLKRKCEGQPISCFSKEIQKEEIYHFPADETLSEDLWRVFPSCALGKKGVSEGGSCEEKREAFHRLRKAVFLENEGREFLFKTLSCIYKEAGFFENAKGLDRLALGSSKDMTADLLAEEIKRGSKNMRLIRALSNTQDTKATLQAFQMLSQSQGFRMQEIIQALGWTGAPEDWELFKKVSRDENRAVRSSMAQAVGEIGGAKGLALLEQMSQDEDGEVRSSVAQAVGEIGSEEGLDILRQMSQDEDGEVRSFVAQAVGKIGSEEGLNILRQMSQDEDGEVRSSVAQAVGKIGSEEGLDILRQMSQDEDGEVRASVAQAVGEIGSEEGLNILKRLSQDESREVRSSVAQVAAWMGDEGGMELFAQMVIQERERRKQKQ